MFKITNGEGFHITFANGYTCSVQWGPYHYCDHVSKEPCSARTAEIAYFKGTGPLIEFPEVNDAVKSRVSADEVAVWLAKVAAL